MSRVSSVTSVYDSTLWTYGSGDLVSSSDYVLDGANSRILTAPHATILFGGDMMFDRSMRVASEAKGDDFLFSCLVSELRNADLVPDDRKESLQKEPIAVKTSEIEQVEVFDENQAIQNQNNALILLMMASL